MPIYADPANHVGTRVRAVRLARGLSLAEVAGQTISEEELLLLEQRVAWAGRTVLHWLAERLGCSPDLLSHGVSRYVAADLEQRLTRATRDIEQGARTKARASLEALLREPSLLARPDLWWSAVYQRSRVLGAEGLNTEAAECLKGLLNVTRLDDSDYIARELAKQNWQRTSAAIALCRCLREAGSLDESIRIGEEAIAAELTSGWSVRLVELASTLVASYAERGHSLRASQLAIELTDVAETLDDPRARLAAANAQLALLHHPCEALALTSLRERALRYQHQVDAAGRERGRLGVSLAQAMLRVEPAHADEADRILTTAQAELLEGHAGVADLAVCLVTRAQTDLLRSAPDRALVQLEPLMETITQISVPLAIEAHRVRGAAYRLQGRPRAAARDYQMAADLCERMNAPDRAARLYLSQADLSTAGRDADARLRSLQRAIAQTGI